MDWTGCKYVERVPGKMGGVPVLVHSRFSADNLVELYGYGESVEDILDTYDLEEETVRGVLAFAGVLRPDTTAA